MLEKSKITLDVKDYTSELTSRLQDADERKAEGNVFFRAGKWNEAISAYASALALLPQLVPQDPTQPTDCDEDEVASGSTNSPNHSNSMAEEAKLEQKTELDLQCAKVRSVLNANIGACYVKLGDHKQAVDACSQALHDDPTYVKALQRRAASNEEINSWSSLTAAQEDYNALLKLSIPQSDIRAVESKLRQLTPRIEVAQKTETAEMLDKLKGVGNSILAGTQRTRRIFGKLFSMKFGNFIYYACTI
ncbi:hypothetical protein BDQ17DRAFT_1340910 [Cyathus striatus]|nr:hypothetical protein BDQ17DRAFT_1340910 [Cyathus striatus]